MRATTSQLVRQIHFTNHHLGPIVRGANPALLAAMIRRYSELEGVTGKVIKCAIEVHRVLGAGLLESVYRECLIAELNATGLAIACGRKVPIVYKGLRLRTVLEVDLMIEEQVIVELKAVDGLHAIHEAQLITYLKLTGCPAGLLINFNEVLLKNGLRRLDRPDLYREKKLLRGTSQ